MVKYVCIHPSYLFIQSSVFMHYRDPQSIEECLIPFCCKSMLMPGSAYEHHQQRQAGLWQSTLLGSPQAQAMLPGWPGHYCWSWDLSVFLISRTGNGKHNDDCVTEISWQGGQLFRGTFKIERLLLELWIAALPHSRTGHQGQTGGPNPTGIAMADGWCRRGLIIISV